MLYQQKKNTNSSRTVNQHTSEKMSWPPLGAAHPRDLGAPPIGYDSWEDRDRAVEAKRRKLAQEPSSSSEDESETEVCTKGKPLGITNEYGDWLSVHGFSPDKFRVSTKGYYQIYLKSGWTKASRGHLQEDGYRKIRVENKKYHAHFLFCTAFYGVRPSELHTAQHGFGAKGDNSIDNIKGWATSSEQRTKYRKPCKDHCTGKPILVWKFGTPKADATWYPSGNAANKATGANDLRAVATGSIGQSGGFCAAWAPPLESQDNLPFEGYAPAQALTEEWCAVNSTLWVSSRGRAWCKNSRGNDWGYKFTPKRSDSKMYATIGIKRRLKRFHRIVFETFFPGVAQERVIDHIDQDKTNNQLHNLRPLTHAQNCRNVTRKDRTQIKNSLKKPVRGRPMNTSVWILHKPSLAEAAEELARHLKVRTNQANIGTAIRKGRHYKGWQIEFV
jgi:hypothetical protein